MIVELVVLALFLGLLGSAAAGRSPAGTSPRSSGAAWSGVGLVIPLVLDFVGHRVRRMGAVAAALVLVGGFVLRYVVVMSIQA